MALERGGTIVTGSKMEQEDLQVARARVARAEAHLAALEEELRGYEMHGKDDRAKDVKAAMKDAKAELDAAKKELHEVAPEELEPGTFAPLPADQRPLNAAGIPLADRADADNGAPLGGKVKRDKDDPKPSKAAEAAAKAADEAVSRGLKPGERAPEKFGVEEAAGPGQPIPASTPLESNSSEETTIPLPAEARPRDGHGDPLADSVTVQKNARGEAAAGVETATNEPKSEKAVKSKPTRR